MFLHRRARLVAAVSPCAWRCDRRRGTPSPSRPPFWRPGGIGYLLLLLGACLREGAVYAAQARHRHNELHEHGANALSVAHWRANAMLDGPRGCGKRRPRKPQNRIVLLLRASDAHKAAEGRGGGSSGSIAAGYGYGGDARARQGGGGGQQTASERAAVVAGEAERGRWRQKAACPAGCAAAGGGKQPCRMSGTLALGANLAGVTSLGSEVVL
jgi:hypothetical protein